MCRDTHRSGAHLVFGCGDILACPIPAPRLGDLPHGQRQGSGGTESCPRFPGHPQCGSGPPQGLCQVKAGSEEKGQVEGDPQYQPSQRAGGLTGWGTLVVGCPLHGTGRCLTSGSVPQGAGSLHTASGDRPSFSRQQPGAGLNMPQASGLPDSPRNSICPVRRGDRATRLVGD